MSRPSTLIVGVGSPHGDDQIGWLVVERLADHAHDGIRLHKAKSPVDLLDWLNHVERLIVCDGCRGTAEVGAVKRWTWPAPELMEIRWAGTHDLSLPAVLSLAEQLGQLPQKTIIWGVEVESTAAFEGCSEAALQGVSAVVFRIADELTAR